MRKGQPVVGETYLVKMAKHSMANVLPSLSSSFLGRIMSSISETWYPVFDEAHTDPEFINALKTSAYKLEGQPSHLHYHVDYRFLDDIEMLDVGGFTLMPDAPTWPIITLDIKGDIHTKYEEKVCYRELPPRGLRNGGVETLEEIYKGHRMECFKCPHQQFNLAQFPVDSDGGIICPMHGLKWHAQTGELVRRDIEGEYEAYMEKETTPEGKSRMAAMLDGINPAFATAALQLFGEI
ncbi:MAG: Rieske 2Fe-2S domain-containing protein [Cyanobacteria bacterium P01_A01_bin.123]